MTVNIVTKEDLLEFRQQLLNDLKSIIQTKPNSKKQWLKSVEVKKLLQISSGTLQNLRINGTLTFTKVGSIIYYNHDDIEAILERNKTIQKKGMSDKSVQTFIPLPSQRF